MRATKALWESAHMRATKALWESAHMRATKALWESAHMRATKALWESAHHRVTKALASLRICADSTKPSLLDDAVSTKILYAGPYIFFIIISVCSVCCHCLLSSWHISLMYGLEFLSQKYTHR